MKIHHARLRCAVCIGLIQLLIELPKLASITSEVGSFLCSRTVTLEGRQKGGILIDDVDIPNLSNVRLPDSFKRVKSNTISSSILSSPFL